MNKMNKKGFTLIEMLVVIAIIAVLVAIIVPTVTNSTTKATASANAANLRTAAAQLTIEATAEPKLMDKLKTDGLAAADGKFTFAPDSNASTDNSITVSAPKAKKLSCAAETGFAAVSLTANTEMFAKIVDGELKVVYGTAIDSGVTIDALSTVAETGKGPATT